MYSEKISRLTVCSVSRENSATSFSCDFTYGFNNIKFDIHYALLDYNTTNVYSQTFNKHKLEPEINVNEHK